MESTPNENIREKESPLDIKENFPPSLFEKVKRDPSKLALSRPSLSYWQDAFYRFRKNKQSLFAFFLATLLMLFSYVGPLIWTKDPSLQNISNPAVPPNWGQKAVVVPESPENLPKIYEEKEASVIEPLLGAQLGAVNGLKVVGVPNTYRVELNWDYLPGSTSYQIYRSEIEPLGESLGIPIGEVEDPKVLSYLDELSIEARTYYYSVVAKGADGEESPKSQRIEVTVVTGITPSSLIELGLKGKVGDSILLGASPLGTDALGRDLLSRLMAGGRISLSIGIWASLLSVLFGILLGGVSGFFGGAIDSILMRFTDLITGLPFLLFMILLKVILSSGPGESGTTALLISLVVLSWTGTARLVRGQILQLRDSEFVQAARMMGAQPAYLILRHMLPNLIGVILVTLTFQIPSAIFTEAFLSFIGLGVAAPATSWGSLCNDALQSLLTRPNEFFAPAIVVSLTVLSFNLLGDGLRDALDPKLRSNE